MNKKYISEIITEKQIAKWQPGQNITLSAGTGAGKSHFIKYRLNDFAASQGKKVLLLVHRLNCLNQFTKELENKTDNINIVTYQSIETEIKRTGKPYDFSEYGYIVSDEFHYFISDAGFNVTTDMSLNEILDAKDQVKIFMSATGEIVRKYINEFKGIQTIDLDFDSNYKHIKHIRFFESDENIEEYINYAIERKDKSMFFIQSAEKAYQLYKKYKKHSMLNVSKSNDKYYKYVDEKKVNQMLSDERFDDLILITTTTMDTGVNIIDPDIKNIVIDVFDPYTIKQCVGRKRITDNERINLYIKNSDGKKLNGMKRASTARKEKADYLQWHGSDEYVKKYARDTDISNMVYVDTAKGLRGKTELKINELMLFYSENMIEMIDKMLKRKRGYAKYVAGMFDMSRKYDFEHNPSENEKTEELNKFLKSYEGIEMLQVKDRKPVIDAIDVKSNGRQLKKIEALNSALEELEVDYRIVQYRKTISVDGKRKNYPNAWKVTHI